LKQSWLIDLFIICWKFLFLCKSWLILSALILLLFNCSNLVYTFLLRSYLDLFALLTLVNLRIFLLKYLTQILFKSICSNLFTLLTLIDLRIFLLKYLAQILLRSCSDFAQISCSDLAQILFKYFAQIYLLKSICSVNTCRLENLLAQIFYSNLAQILLRSCSDLAQISCSDLFVLSTLVNLRIFLFRSESSKIFEQEVYFASCILLLVSCFILTL